MAFVLWLTGVPGSGKSTVADGLKDLFPGSIILRMDDMRRFVTPDPNYSEEEREILYRSMIYMAKVLSDNKHTVIIDATAHKKAWRDLARKEIHDFFEVYLRCPVEICRKREMARPDTHHAPRDIYQKAKEGWPVPGVNVPYEESQEPEVVVDTDKLPIVEAVEKIGRAIKSKIF